MNAHDIVNVANSNYLFALFEGMLGGGDDVKKAADLYGRILIWCDERVVKEEFTKIIERGSIKIFGIF